MIKKYYPPCLGVLVGIIFMFFFMRNCAGPSAHPTQAKISTDDKTVVVKFTTRLDTLYVKKFIHDTITITKPVARRVDTVFVIGTKVVEVMPKIKRVYEDTYKPQDSIEVKYKANVTGTLDNISLDYKDWRAEKTILRTNNIETTTIITKKPKGLYIGIGSNLGLNELSPSLQYVNDKNIFGIKYNVAGSQIGIQNIGLTYSRKLF